MIPKILTSIIIFFITWLFPSCLFFFHFLIPFILHSAFYGLNDIDHLGNFYLCYEFLFFVGCMFFVEFNWYKTGKDETEEN